MSNDLWNGNGNWTGNPSDWSAGVPTSSETAEIQSGSNTLTSTTTVAGVQVDPGAYLYVEQPGFLTVTGGFTNNGTFDFATGAGDAGVTIGGTLTNSTTINIGNGSLSSPVTISASALSNTGTINITGNNSPQTTHQATLDITGSAPPSQLFGTLNIYADAKLEFSSSGSIQTISAGDQLLLAGASAQINSDGVSGNSGLSGLQTNAGTLSLQGNWDGGYGGVSLTTDVGLANIGTFYVDTPNGSGGSTINFGGALYNIGTTQIGNTGLGVPTTVTASNFDNAGNFTIEGSDYSGSINQTTVEITNPAPVALYGNLSLYGDADLEFGGGVEASDVKPAVSGGSSSIEAIGTGVTLLMDGGETQISDVGGKANTALASLSTNSGTLNFEGNWNVGPGGVQLTTTTGFTNMGDFYVDNDNGAGGSSIFWDGPFNNYGTTEIGNGGLGVPTTVFIKGFNNVGTFDLSGSDYYGSVNQATLKVYANAPLTLTGAVNLYGDADMQFNNGFTSIGYGASLLEQGAQSRISVQASTANSGLSNLSLNNGVLNLQGNYNSAPGGVTIDTNAGVALTDIGTIYVDSNYGTGGSTLSIGGSLNIGGLLANQSPTLATLDIGNADLSAPTTVSATALSSTGNIDVIGNASAGATNQAELAISGTAPGAINGGWAIEGDALLQFASGSIATIDAGSALEVDGGEAQVSDSGGAADSALSGLALNYGTWTMQGNSSNGAGGGTVTTTTSLTSHALYIDSNTYDGGTTLTIGGNITNTYQLVVGNYDLSAPTTVTATSLTNYSWLNGPGYVVVEGNTTSGTTNQATLDITGTAMGTLSGVYYVRGDATLEYASGSFNTLGAQSYLEIDGAQATVTDAGGTTNSALSGLSNINGELVLLGNSGYGAGGDTLTTTTGMTINGELAVDSSGGNGGSTVTLGGNSTNRGTLIVGNTGPSAATLVTVSGNLTNFGNVDIYGNSTYSAELHVTGSGGVTNDGNLTLAAYGLLVTPSFTQNADTATIAGTLTSSSTINAEGGLIDFTTAVTSTGTLNIYGGGTMEFGAADSDNVNFKATTGTLEIGAPASFTGTIAGFSGNDVIDLLNTSVSGLAYSGGTLTITLSGGGTDTLKFSGSYTTASFTDVSDGSSGTDIILTPVVQWVAGSGTWSTASNWAGGTPPTSSQAAVFAGTSGYTVTVNAAFSVGSVDELDPSVAIEISAPGQTESVTTNWINRGYLYVDNSGGGSTLTISGSLVNANYIDLGNSSLTASSTVNAASLYNSGTLILYGSEAKSPTNLMTLDITGSAPGVLTGDWYLHGDAMIEFGGTTGIANIAQGAELQLDGTYARVSLGNSLNNSALSALATIAGTFDMEGNWSTGPGGSTVTTTGGVANTGTLEMDVYSADGDSTLTIGGGLTNQGSITIGNDGLSANTTMSASSLTNNGTLTLWGSDSASPTSQAALDLTSSPGVITGGWYIHGDAVVDFKSGGVTSIAAGAELQLDGTHAQVNTGATTGNSGLTGLFANAGTFDMEGNWSTGPGGSTVTTTTGFTNYGTLELDVYGGDGDSTFNIGGNLTNIGTLTIGNSSLSATSTVTATGLTNNGTIDLVGNSSGTSSNAAILDITGASPGVLTGSLYLHGDSLLEFKTGSITSIAEGIELQLDGANNKIESGSYTGAFGGLSQLSNSAGTLDMEGDWSTGPGGASVTTSVSFTNFGSLELDVYGADGGNSFTIGGSFTNHGQVQLGNSGLGTGYGSSSTDGATLTATSLINDGGIDLQGNTSSGSTHQALMDITGTASGSLNGALYVRGDAELEFASGSFTSLNAGGWLEIDGAQASVSDKGGSANSALSQLGTVSGTMLIRGDSSFGAGATSLTTTVAMTVAGELSIDQYGADGGTTVTIGGTLTNQGTFIEGNTGSTNTTTVNAAGLTNYTSLSIYGNGSNLGDMTLTGGATNYGNLYIGTSAVLNDGSQTYLQYSGTTTVAGALEAGSIQSSGGLINFTSAITSGDGTNGLQINAGGAMEFAAVDSSHTVTFAAADGDLELSSPSNFLGTISGFGGNDVIDLLNTAATSESYSGTTLTVLNGATTVASLTLTGGSYTTSSFALVGDGHGGTDIVDPPNAAVNQLVQSMAGFGATSASAQTPHPYGNLTETNQVLAPSHA